MNHFSDRSRTESQFRCPMQRYWNYHFANQGVVPVDEGADLLFGKAIHLDLEYVRTDAPYENRELKILVRETSEIQTPDGFSASDEWTALYSGLSKTFRKWLLPSILDEYDWIDSEIEITFELLEQKLHVTNPTFDVLARIEKIANTKTSAGVGNQLHEP